MPGTRAAGVGAWGVGLASIPSLLELAALSTMGWVASTSAHTVSEVRPLRPTTPELLRLSVARIGVIVIALTIGLLAASPVIFAAAALRASWLLVIGWAVVLGTMLADQLYRARSASAGPIPAPLLLPEQSVYLVAGFAADPQGAGHGTELARRLFTAADHNNDKSGRSTASFVLRARTERLIATYAGWGFQLVDPRRRIMVRPHPPTSQRAA